MMTPLRTRRPVVGECLERAAVLEALVRTKPEVLVREMTLTGALAGW
jgi:hypothetical protein